MTPRLPSMLWGAGGPRPRGRARRRRSRARSRAGMIPDMGSLDRWSASPLAASGGLEQGATGQNFPGPVLKGRLRGVAGLERANAECRAARDRIADVVAFAIDQPEDTTINEFTVGPANQPW